MNAIRELRLGIRLAIGFGFVLTLLVGVSIVGIFSMSKIQERLREITETNNQQMRNAVAMRNAVNQLAARSRDLVLYDGVRKKAAGVATTQVRQAYDAAEKQLGTMFAERPDTSDREKALFAQLKQLKESTLPRIEKIVQLAMGDLTEQAVQYLASEVDGPVKTWLDTLGELADYEEHANIEAAQDAQTAYQKALLLLIGLCATGVVLGIATAWLITRSITRPIAKAVHIAETVSTGDLTSRINAQHRDETGKLLTALQLMNTNLVQVVSTVRASSDSIATGVGEIAAGNQDLSHRTEQQASNLQQTAASMQQIGLTVQSSAETARQAAELAGTAAKAAIQGGAAVDQVVSTMEEIAASSRKVSEIIGVIDGIAFQTNILALNAAVEAARAGEQGRGFAVVASEVRSLAGRSAQAAKEIKALISESVQKIDTGAGQAEAAGGTMKGIVAQVRRVADLITEISAATSEQSAGMAEVSQSVTRLDEATQQNAALVEQSAAAADNLNMQAGRLVEAVSAFKLSVDLALDDVPSPVAGKWPEGRPNGGTAANSAGRRALAAPGARAPLTIAEA